MSCLKSIQMSIGVFLSKGGTGILILKLRHNATEVLSELLGHWLLLIVSDLHQHNLASGLLPPLAAVL